MAAAMARIVSSPVVGHVGFAAATAVLALACVRPSIYQAPVTKFRDASAVVIESTKEYLVALNKTERDHYIDDQVASQAPIQLDKIEEVQIFDAEAIAARLDALDRLADYTELLYLIATSAAPETIRGRAKDLGSALSKLSGEVAGLTGVDNDNFRKVAGTVFPVIGGVLQGFVEMRLESALKKAITTGTAPVNELIEAIQLDAEIAYERKRNALSKRRADAALAYNAESAKAPKVSAAALRRLANAISDTEDQWEAFQLARPAAGLEAMRDANLALERFARNARPSPAEIAAFFEAVEVFAVAAARVGESVRQLNALQEREPR
jgi:hypothetical protein